MNNITGLTHLILMNNINRNLHKSETEESAEKHCNNALFYCKTPDGEVLSAYLIDYEDETENVIVLDDYKGYTYFSMPRDEYDAQLKNFKKTGYFDFMNKLLNTTDAKLRCMKKEKPAAIKEANHFAFFTILGFVFLIVAMFWDFAK